MSRFKLLSLALAMMFCAACKSPAPITTLSEQDFKNPPSSTKPRTWMHAMSGNMSKVGMTKDLEAIQEAGIGGVLLFNIAYGIPYGDIEYNSAEHHDILKHAAAECERLGLSFGFHNCAGWSSSGGPWITPEESMKMLASRQVVVDGGDVDIVLPQPTNREDLYRDVAILAYPALESDIVDAAAKPRITASDPAFDIDIAFDGRTEVVTNLTKDGAKESFVKIDYGKPFPLSSFYISTNNKKLDIDLYISDDGVDYQFAHSFPTTRVSTSEWCQQGSFEPLNSRYYMLLSKDQEPILMVRDIQLSASAYVDNFLSKNCLGRVDDEKLVDTKIISENMVIKKSEIRDLTADLTEGGVLKTTLPDGKWTIMRIGYTSTSARNRPASNVGRGLECDKFDRVALEKHFEAFSAKVVNNVKDVAPNALQYTEVDSYEMVGQNWTQNLDQIFEDEQGYDLTPFLPLMFGKYIDDAYTCEAVLSDFRDVCCALMDENYFGAFGDMCDKYGIQYYLEPYTNGPFNYLNAGGKCDIPMGEFWMEGKPLFIDEAISSGHIYGKNVISAESFTASSSINWSGHPAMTKPTGDWAWKKGFNEFMFHRYVHQANTHVRPGMTMSQWGFHFDGTQTWWLNAGKEWFKYIARGSYMLRQGVPVIDVMTFVGDAAPTGAPVGDYPGFKSDAVNAEVLIDRVSLKDGKMLLPEGAEYQCLVLRNCDKIKMPTLERLCEIAESGVPVMGELPSSLLGYSDEGKDMDRFAELVARIKSCDNYYETGSFDELVETEGIERDFFAVDCDDIEMDYTHRHLADDSHIYFISNPDSVDHTFVCNFRVSGYAPELWRAMGGSIERVGNYEIKGDRTELSIELETLESVFVVFREEATQKSLRTAVKREGVASLDLNSDWSVLFDEDYGYGETVEFESLCDWSKSANDEIKYYSGSALYKRSIEVDAAALADSNCAMLDLGEVNIVAEVVVNGERVNTLWMEPYSVDIYNYLTAGENTIEITLTNQWTNRLIGDERYPRQDGGYQFVDGMTNAKMPRWYVENKPMPAGPRITFSATKFYDVDSPLIPAGLVGPVEIEFCNATKVVE